MSETKVYTIWKFPFDITDNQEIEMPNGARIIKIDVQNNQPCLWAIVDPTKQYDTEPRVIRVYGTGHHVFVLDKLDYLDSFQLLGGQLVFHVFEQQVAQK